MQREPAHLLNEADIGSGEKSSGQKQTEQEIAKVHNPKMDNAADKTKTKKESVRKVTPSSGKR